MVRTSIRRAIRAGASAALGALALCAMGTAPAAAATIPPCATSRLVVWLNTQEGGAAAGTAYSQLTFTNLGGACRLAGYPGVSAVGLAGRQLGRAAARDRAVRPRSVVLDHGEHATATIGIATAANSPADACRPVLAAGLRVYPPNQTRARLVPFPFPACSRRGPVILTVRAVTTANASMSAD